MIYDSVFDIIGKTPLVRLRSYEAHNGCGCELIAKLEMMNPAGSAKDRAALRMICDAEADGRLKPGSVIVEPTSGNTGIALASLGAKRGYKVILTMPESMSEQRRKLLKAYGAQLVLTPAAEGMTGAVKKAQELAESTDGSVIMGQFSNPSNALAHYNTTGPEIWHDTNGQLDALVVSVGTGGTLTGTARYIKEQNNAVKVIAVEPESSPLLSEGRAGAHKIQGIGANFVPELLDRELIDRIVTVSDDDAIDTAHELAVTEGLLCGISSGAALAAARKLSVEDEFKGKRIVIILPDTGERY